MRLLLFFFQAEDAIRDYKVTGFQRCALPILIQPPDGPAPAPTPQAPVHHRNSPTPWTAAVPPPSVRLVPAPMPSAPSRMRPSSGRVAAHTAVRPCRDQMPPGRDAREPARLP